MVVIALRRIVIAIAVLTPLGGSAAVAQQFAPRAGRAVASQPGGAPHVYSTVGAARQLPEMPQDEVEPWENPPQRPPEAPRSNQPQQTLTLPPPPSLEHAPLAGERFGPGGDELLEPVAEGEWEEGGYSEFPEPPAENDSSGTGLNRGRWYFQSDAVYMNRGLPKQRLFPLAVEITSNLNAQGQVTSQTLRDALLLDPNLGYSPGLRTTVGRMLCRDDKNRDHAIEFTFLGFDKWRDTGALTVGIPDTATQTTTISSVIDATVGGFNGAKSQSFTYTSKFDSYEINYRISRRLGRDRMVLERDGTWLRTCAPAILPSLFAGIRVVTVDEGFDYHSAGAFLSGKSGLYDILTHNDLVGIQIGTDVAYQNCGWRMAFRGKAGPYINFADQSSFVHITEQTGSPADRHETASTDVLAFVGEINLTGSYQIRPNMAFRAGYDLMWVNALALAPTQLIFSAEHAPRVITGGEFESHRIDPKSRTIPNTLFYNGIRVGLEVVW